jgi:hypothetical protein
MPGEIIPEQRATSVGIRILPRSGMEIDRIHQRAVDVEDNRLDQRTTLCEGERPDDLTRPDDGGSLLRTVFGESASGYVVVPTGQAPAEREDLPILTDSGSEFAAAYAAEPGTVLLVRPDGYIGWCSAALTVAGLRSYVARLVRFQIADVRNRAAGTSTPSTCELLKACCLQRAPDATMDAAVGDTPNPAR